MLLRRPRAVLPNFIAPQLSLLVEKSPKGDAWLHEIKYDGYRLHARIDAGKVRLLTRTGLDWTRRFETTALALGRLRARSAYIDGEICAMRADGTTSFADLQDATDSRRTTALIYFAFDLLYLDGEDWTGSPLLERKAALERLLEDAPPAIRYSDHLVGDGDRVFKGDL